jgi:signal transduction histidine kinase
METTATATQPQFVFADQFVIQDAANSEFYALLLRGMTHKLNNLLAVIQGFSSLILMDEGLDETIAENLGHMKEASTNASGLSERMLPAGGCSQITIQDLKLEDFLPMVEDGLKEPFEKLGIPVSIKCPANVPTIKADPGRLKDILLDLLNNAAEAAAEGGGQASFEIYGPGDFSAAEKNRVDILVRNSGSTIPADKIAKIWEPFYSSKDSKHLGVGLTVAGVLAAQMDMKLGVHSADNTTTFWLSIPAA